MRYFHGTTIENFHLMILNNFCSSTKTSATWSVSDDNNLYLYPLDKVASAHCMEDELVEYITERAISEAFDSAEITALTCGTLDSELIVIEFEIDDGITEHDFSCDNMDSIADCIHLDDVDKSMIVSIHTSNDYNPSLRMIKLAPLMTKELIGDVELTEHEQDAIDQLQGAEIYLEPTCYEWSTNPWQHVESTLEYSPNPFNR